MPDQKGSVMATATFRSRPDSASSFRNLPQTLIDQERSLANSALRIAIPQGQAGSSVLELLADAGLRASSVSSSSRLLLPLANSDCKLLSAQSTLASLEAGRRDIGFVSSVWAQELGTSAVELLDTGLDPVSVVAAAPTALLDRYGGLPQRELVVASEFERLARVWIATRDIRARYIRSYGDTQALAPEDANVVIDCIASLSPTLAPGLTVIEDIAGGTTRLFASKAAMQDPSKSQRIADFVVLLRSVLAARDRVVVDVNVPASALTRVVESLPCLREPAVSLLSDGAGYAVRASVPRARLAELIPQIAAQGGTDIVITQPTQIAA
jgi:ATP phosphoribosyltransferase-like protein